jgi:hypothetical protein
MQVFELEKFAELIDRRLKGFHDKGEAVSQE